MRTSKTKSQSPAPQRSSETGTGTAEGGSGGRGDGGYGQRGKEATQRTHSLVVKYQSAACILAVFTLTLGVLISSPPNEKHAKGKMIWFFSFQ